jgi:FKBP-type peptidyl-prolyl cis-trans isomerase
MGGFFLSIRAFWVLVAIAGVALISGCGGNSEAESTDSQLVAAISAREREALNKPVIHIPDAPPPKKLVVVDLKKGTGPGVKDGDRLTVQYVGVSYETGEVVYATWGRRPPLTFELGSLSEIEGWEEGLKGMKLGGRRKLFIPSARASRLGGPFIYVVDLIKIKHLPPPESPERPKPKVKVPSGPAPTELVVKDLIEGTGAEAEAGDELDIHYIGLSYKTGKEFESFWERGKVFPVVLGRELVLKGWEEGLNGMRAGGRRQLIIPSRLAYNTGPVVYVIDLLSVKK